MVRTAPSSFSAADNIQLRLIIKPQHHNSVPGVCSVCRNCKISLTGGPRKRRHSSALRRLLLVKFAEPTYAVLLSVTMALACRDPVEAVPLQHTTVAPARRKRSKRDFWWYGTLEVYISPSISRTRLNSERLRRRRSKVSVKAALSN